MSALLDRITIEDGKAGGRPCIRGLRVRVTDVLEMLAAGDDVATILVYHPDLEADDIKACLAYAAQATNHAVIVSAA